MAAHGGFEYPESPGMHGKLRRSRDGVSCSYHKVLNHKGKDAMSGPRLVASTFRDLFPGS